MNNQLKIKHLPCSFCGQRTSLYSIEKAIITCLGCELKKYWKS